MLSAAALLFFVSSVDLRAGGLPPYAMSAIGGLPLTAAVPGPLQAGVFELRLAPAYLMYTGGSGQGGEQGDLKGPGLGVTVTYSLTDHFGLMLMGGHVRADGTREVAVDDLPATVRPTPCGDPCVTTRTGEGDAQGSFVALSLAIDFTRGGRLRFPLFLGGGYMDMRETALDSTNGFKRVGTTKGPGVFVGLAPSILAWRVRVTPFFFLCENVDPSEARETKFAPGSGAVLSQTVADVGQGMGPAAFGIDFNYTPWGLGLTWAPDIGEGFSAYTLKWSRRWGGS